MIAPESFGWSSLATGFYIAGLNLLVIPVHMIVGKLSGRVSDRMFVLISLIGTLVASVG